MSLSRKILLGLMGNSVVEAGVPSGVFKHKLDYSIYGIVPKPNENGAGRSRPTC